MKNHETESEVGSRGFALKNQEINTRPVWLSILR